jgi:hypothetical protein
MLPMQRMLSWMQRRKTAQTTELPKLDSDRQRSGHQAVDGRSHPTSMCIEPRDEPHAHSAMFRSHVALRLRTSQDQSHPEGSFGNPLGINRFILPGSDQTAGIFNPVCPGTTQLHRSG